MTTLEIPRREGREGNRWINRRPSSEELYDWFFDAVKLHDGMTHRDWIGGVVLIQQTEEVDEFVGHSSDGRPQIINGVQHIFYTPYPRVETRVEYFNRYIASNDELTGFILPVPAADPKGLPVGYTAIQVAEADGRAATLVLYSARVLVLKTRGLEWIKQTDPDGVKRLYPHGDIVTYGPMGTKSVPMLDRWSGADPHAIARAQTGAIGRALGMAGFLVFPGSGVASAEDMQEVPGAGSSSPTLEPEQAEAPKTEDEIRAQVATLIAGFQEDSPERLASFQEWAKGRGLGRLEDVSGVALKGVLRKLEKIKDEEAVVVETSELPDIAGEDS